MLLGWSIDKPRCHFSDQLTVSKNVSCSPLLVVPQMADKPVPATQTSLQTCRAGVQGDELVFCSFCCHITYVLLSTCRDAPRRRGPVRRFQYDVSLAIFTTGLVIFTAGLVIYAAWHGVWHVVSGIFPPPRCPGSQQTFDRQSARRLSWYRVSWCGCTLPCCRKLLAGFFPAPYQYVLGKTFTEVI